MIDKGVDDNVQDKKTGFTVLMISVMSGQTEIAQLLIDGGADINKKGKNGMTALSIAKAKDNTDMIKLLQKAGAK